MRRSHLVSVLAIVIVAVGSLVATILAGNSPELGLDLQGGASVVLAPPAGVDDPEALDQAIEIIRNRVDALGVAEPDITRQGNAIVIELPGVTDQAQAIEVVGQTAELRFRPVLEILPPEGTPPPETTSTTATTATTVTTAASTTTATTAATGDITSTTLASDTSTTAAAAAESTTTATTVPSTTSSTIPPGEVETTKPEDDTAETEVVLPLLDEDGEVVQRYRLGPATVTGRAVETATADLQGISWVVSPVFTSEGIDAFNALAAQCNPASAVCPPSSVNQETGQAVGAVAIVLDGVVQSAPAIQAANFQRDEITISGSFDEDSAKALALALRFGALPVQLEQESASTVSASLGEDSLNAGLLAGGIGTALVLLYMILYYRALGLVVVLGLMVWAALQWSIISYLGVSQGLALSLAGITGIIVSVGVTVDSYVVYFERLKDEIRAGRTLRSSVDRAFKRAFRTIITADTSAFIGAALLYILTVGPVRGFAFFLGLSTLLDVVVAWFFTRPLVSLLARRKVFTSDNFLGVARGLGTTRPAPSLVLPGTEVAT